MTAFADPPFAATVLALFARADIRDELWWTTTPHDIELWANVSDVFAWGGGDFEPITPDHLPALQQAYADCVEAGAPECTAELYTARIRGTRPQGAAYPRKARAAALFDACGPERPLDLLNPKRPPQTEEPTP